MNHCVRYHNIIEKSTLLVPCVRNSPLTGGSRYKGPVMSKMLPSHDVVMSSIDTEPDVYRCLGHIYAVVILLFTGYVLSRRQKNPKEMSGSPCQAAVNPCRGWPSWRAAKYDLLRIFASPETHLPSVLELFCYTWRAPQMSFRGILFSPMITAFFIQW